MMDYPEQPILCASAEDRLFGMQVFGDGMVFRSRYRDPRTEAEGGQAARATSPTVDRRAVLRAVPGVVAAMCGLRPLTALAQSAPANGENADDKSKLSGVEKIGDDLYRVGKMTVDLKAKTATVGGTINMSKGMVEYFACAPHGKLHESVLSVDVRPLHLQVALILLDLEPKGGLRYQGDTQVPKGSPVDVWVTWQRAGKVTKVRAEEMVWDIPRKQPMQRKPWVFSGSRIDGNGFVADRGLSLIATYRDPDAIVNNALPSGSDDTVYKSNERIVPPYGTPVTVILSPAA
jgi:hypothetical protein